MSTTALDIYEAAFDVTRETAPMNREERIQDVEDYAFNAMNLNIDSDVATKIVDCAESYKGLDEENGEYENAYFGKIVKPLRDIEI